MLGEEAYAKQGQSLPYLPPEVVVRPQDNRAKTTVRIEKTFWDVRGQGVIHCGQVDQVVETRVKEMR